MRTRDFAPLYVATHELALWLELRAAAGATGDLIGPARELLARVALALTFPRNRQRHLLAADEQLVRLRVMIRMARDAGRLPPRCARYAGERLLPIGRMLGGWQRALRRRAGQPAATDDEDLPGSGPERPQARHPRRQLQERRQELPGGLPQPQPPG